MIERSTTYYECEMCGELYEDSEKAIECEEKDKVIDTLLREISDRCERLKDLGAKISLRTYPYYGMDEINRKVEKIISHNKEYKILLGDDNIYITPCSNYNNSTATTNTILFEGEQLKYEKD